MKPSHLIFRLPDEETDVEGLPEIATSGATGKAVVMCEIPISEDGVIATHGRKFFVRPGDSYATMNRSQVVFAHKPDQNTSNVLLSLTVTEQDSEEPVNVHEMCGEDLQAVVSDILVNEFRTQ